MSELIGGEEAIIAVYRGEQVQFRGTDEKVWWNMEGENWEVKDFRDDKYEFRKKPKTISVTLELPESFHPKFGEVYWYVTPSSNRGYDNTTLDGDTLDHNYTQFGAYRTEEDVIKVRDAFRKLKAK